MKIAFIADIHWNSNLPYGEMVKTNLGNKVIEINSRLLDLEKVLNTAVDTMTNLEVEKLFILGDVYRSKTPNTIERLYYHRFLKYCTTKNIMVHIFSGNHDTGIANISALLPDSLNTSSEFLLDNTSTMLIDDCCFHIVPWGKNLPDTSLLDKTKFNIFLGHCTVSGSTMGHLDYILDDKEKTIPIEYFTPYNLAICGHIHKPQKIENFYYVGSPSRVDFGERDEEKRFLVLNTKTKEVVSHNIPNRDMVQVNLNFISNPDIENFSLISDGVLVKVVITYDSVSKPKVEKLMSFLKSKKYHTEIIYRASKLDNISKIGKTNTYSDSITEYITEKIPDKHLQDVVKSKCLNILNSVLTGG